jgi:hypothetical protein
MEKYQFSLRVTANERQMLMQRAARYGLSVNGLIRFWINSEPGSPRAFSKNICNECAGTGKISGYPCKECRGAGYSYLEI